MRHEKQSTESRIRHFGRVLFAVVVVTLVSSPAWSSGGLSGAGDRGRFSGGTNSTATDPAYHSGKAIFQGRSKSYRDLSICLSQNPSTTSSTETVKLSAASLRPFKRGPLTDLTTRLVDCESPETQIARILKQDDFRALVYFLNKRFRLKLAT